MISLTCTHCKAVLTMDDAFAGGACRCQHCGTIQTVPIKLKGSSKPSSASGKALYRNKARDASAGTGLDDLADAVLSSGLSSSRLRRRTSRQNFMLVFFGALTMVILVSAIVIYFAWRAPAQRQANSAPAADSSSAAGASGAGENPTATAQPQAPNFCGVPLDGQTVIYVLDRGDSTRDVFGELKQACYRSISTLGAQRKFQVIFWNNGSDDSFPTGSPTFATPDNLEAARRTLDDVAAHGKTDITSAFQKAISARPSVIVIATAKAWDLDDAFVTQIQNMRGGNATKIHTIALSDPGASTAMKRIASNTGGEFRVVSPGDLKDFGQ